MCVCAFHTLKQSNTAILKWINRKTNDTTQELIIKISKSHMCVNAMLCTDGCLWCMDTIQDKPNECGDEQYRNIYHFVQLHRLKSENLLMVIYCIKSMYHMIPPHSIFHSRMVWWIWIWILRMYIQYSIAKEFGISRQLLFEVPTN